MKLHKPSVTKTSIVDAVEKNMDRAQTSINSADWYKDAFELSTQEDLKWDAAQDTIKALEELRTEDDSSPASSS